jgi:hypothetical protein
MSTKPNANRFSPLADDEEDARLDEPALPHQCSKEGVSDHDNRSS